jgi:hypothetical protein
VKPAFQLAGGAVVVCSASAIAAIAMRRPQKQ